jgi:hypothetical protein
MRKFLLIFTATLSLTITRAQTNVYHPFPDSAYWRTDLNYVKANLGPCYANFYFQYYSKGDTVINSAVYEKIYRSGVRVDTLSCYDPNYVPATPPAGYAGALKYNFSDHKAFFVFANTSFDSLLYDYTLAVGDTMKGHLGTSVFFTSNLAVLSIDSVLINGQYRKRWNFTPDNNNDSTYFIEGLGSSAGLLEPLNTYAADLTYRHLICVKDSSINYFSSNAFSSVGCNLIYTGITELNESNYSSVFPNPFSDQATFHSGKLLQNASLTVYNSFGQVVKQMDHLSGETIIFQKENLQSGVYFFRLMQDNKIISADRFVITDN